MRSLSAREGKTEHCWQKDQQVRHGLIGGFGMFRNRQKAQCGWNMRCSRDEAGPLGGERSVGEADLGQCSL